jgi:hypothetical protein
MHRTAGLAVCETSCPVVDDVASFGDQYDGAYDATILQGALDCPVESGPKSTSVVVIASVRN